MVTGWENPRISSSSFWERAGQESPPAAEREVSRSSDQIEDLVGSRSPRANQILPTAKVISEELNDYYFTRFQFSQQPSPGVDLATLICSCNCIFQLSLLSAALWCQALTCLLAYCRVNPHCLEGALIGTYKPVKYPGLSLCRC